jgi:hypothetical protein
MELAGVCYERGWRHSSCAVRSPDGAFWYFKNDREPWCLGREIDDVLPGQVTVIVFQRRGGAADFGGVCAAVPRAAAVPQPRSVSLAGSASCDQSSVGTGGSGGGAQAERMKFLFGLRNLYWDTLPRTYADVYFDRDSNALALVRYKNTSCMVCAVFAGFPGSVRDGLVVRVMLCLSAKRPLSPSAETVEHFGAFVAACQLGGVTQAEIEGAAAASKTLTEAALHKADMKQRQEDAKRLMARRQRELGKEAVAKRRRESADRTGREAMEATLLQGAGAAGHRVRKQETASLGDSAEVARQARAAAAAVASSAAARHGIRPRVADLEESRLFRDLLSQSQFTAAEGGEVVEGLPPDIVDAICAQLRKTFSARKAYELAQEDWFCMLLEWRTFKRSVMLTTALDDDALGLVAALGLLAELMFAVSHRARENARTDVRRPQTSDGQALERLKAAGYEWRQGKVWHRNNCLADSLLQLLVHHRVIYGDGDDLELSEPKREAVCSENRDRLCLRNNGRLMPRWANGRADPEAYLQHHVHAGPTIEFFLEQFVSRTGVPDGGIELHVHTRFDEDVGIAGILDKHSVCVRRPDGVPLIMHVFCKTGGGLGGYHYDPLFFRGGAGGAVGLVDLAADVPVSQEHSSVAAQTDEVLIEELFGAAEQTDEDYRITQRLHAGDAQAEEVVLDDPELAEATRRSLVDVEGAALQAALDMSMAQPAGDTCAAVEPVGAPVIQEISGDAERHVEADAIARRLEEEAGLGEIDMDQNEALASAVRMSLVSMEATEFEEALRRSLEALDVGAASAVVSGDGAMLASTDDALGSVVEAESSADPERRRVMRRVGQSQHQMRRLRRGNTLTTPSGHDAVDVPVSQGRLRLDSSDDACASHVAKPLESNGLATPVTGAVASEDEQMEDGSSSLDKQIPRYSRPLRRRASKVEMPSLPALPSVPVSRTRWAVERVERVVSIAASGVDCGGDGDDAMAASSVPYGARMLHGQSDAQSSHATATDNAATVGAAVVRRSVRIAAHRSAGSGVAGASVDPVDDGGRGRSAGRRGAPPVRGRGRGQGRS